MSHQGLIVLTPYPLNKTYSDTESALASFSKNLITSLAKHISSIVVITNTKTERVQESDNVISIIRCWKKNTLSSYIQIVRETTKLSATNFLIQLEWNMFGQPAALYMLFLPLLLLILNLLGKKITIVTHGVLLDSSVVIMDPRLRLLGNIAFRLFYRIISLCSSRIVVLEQNLKDRLVQEVGIPWHKIAFIPHGIDTSLVSYAIAEKHKSRKRNEKINVVCPGFINKYKGTDVFVKLTSDLNKSTYSCIIAGGESFNLSTSVGYRAYVEDVKKCANQFGVTITGFLDQDKLVSQLNASDILIFPYRTFISSSGVLSLGITFSKPFLLSESLRPYTDSHDFNLSLHESKLTYPDIFFKTDSSDFAQKIKNAINQKDKFAIFAQLMQKRRSWEQIAYKYKKLLFT